MVCSNCGYYESDDHESDDYESDDHESDFVDLILTYSLTHLLHYIRRSKGAEVLGN